MLPLSREEVIREGSGITFVAWGVLLTLIEDVCRDAEKVVFNKEGVLERISNGKGYIDMSTVDAETSIKISEAVTSKGGHFVEAPVSGSKKPVEGGQLVILAAGDKPLKTNDEHVTLRRTLPRKQVHQMAPYKTNGVSISAIEMV